MSAYYPAVPRKSFWLSEKKWPRDAPDGTYLFLGNAVLLLGEAMFPDWTPSDPKIAFSGQRIDGPERHRVNALMESLGPAVARGQVGFALRADQRGDLKLPRERLGARDGAYATFGNAAWNVDDLDPLFRFGQMRDGKTYVERVPPLDWIYIEKSSLEAFASSLRRTNEEDAQRADSLPHLSPYLRVMLDVARNLKITPDNQPNKASIELEIRALLKQRGIEKPGETFLGYMAQAIREPESQLGRAQKK